MHKRVLALALMSLSSTSGASMGPSDSADVAYLGAQKSYYALKADAARRKRRDAWLAQRIVKLTPDQRRVLTEAIDIMKELANS